MKGESSGRESEDKVRLSPVRRLKLKRGMANEVQLSEVR